MTGQFTLVILITFATSCLLAEVCRLITKYNSFWGNTFAFAFFSLGMTGSPLPVWLFREKFFAQISEQGMPASYLASLDTLASNGMLAIMFISTFVLAIVGSFIAKALMKKHFEKAGIV
jgi:energy-coupling factor transport system substrate-specific component